ncbi:MAG: RNA polymerase sigma factor [Spirochaetes bacterium]|nr:RNA polymerase sigma factor [Spirochaetota bacterium]
MNNPFLEKIEYSEDDLDLIQASLDGNQESLEKLILRHQAWIYNIAFKMVMDHDDASDITQEILIKLITNLSSFDSRKGLFRTWMYRIVANHIINMKKKKFERRIHDFDTYVSLIEKLPDHRSFSHPDSALLAEELKVGCMMGMLMCLNRTARLVFLLGAVFEVPDSIGAELVNVSRDNFRKILSRSRHKVYSYMNGICGHMNRNNKCWCAYKVKNFLDLGMMDPAHPRYSHPEYRRVKDVIERRIDDFTESFYGPFLAHFRNQPFYEPPDMTEWFRSLIQNEEFRRLFDMQGE